MLKILKDNLNKVNLNNALNKVRLNNALNKCSLSLNNDRKGSRNNIGDVWVVAKYTTGATPAATVRARAHLLVTVPLYMRFDPTVGGQ